MEKSATSPWAKLTTANFIKVNPSQLSNFKVRVPGSKSFSNRALIIAACASGQSKISGILKSDDTHWCIETLKKLGTTITLNEDIFEIKKNFNGVLSSEEPLFIGAAGTIARFLPGVLSAACDKSLTIYGDKSLTNRPIKPLIDAIISLEGDVSYMDSTGHLPIRIEPKKLVGGSVVLPADISSQYLSGLLICAPLAQKEVTIKVTTPIVQQNYVKMTIDTMKKFGVTVAVDNSFSVFKIHPQTYKATDFSIESDVSSAGYFFGLGAINNICAQIEGLSLNTLQPDIKILEVLEKMGCEVKTNSNSISVTGPEKLKGGFKVSLKEFSDQALTLGCIAPLADAPITIDDIGHIRKHECDRLEALKEGLERLKNKS